MGGNQSEQQSKASDKDHLDHHDMNFEIHCRLYDRLIMTGEKNKEDKNRMVSRENFQSMFPDCLQRFAELLFSHWLLEQKTDRGALTRQQFANVAGDILHLNERSQTSYYFQLFAQGKPAISKTRAEELLRFCFLLTLSSSSLPLCIPESTIIRSIINSLFGTSSSIDYETFSAWTRHNAPNLFAGIHSWLITMFSQVRLPMEITYTQDDESSTQSHVLSHIVSKSDLLTIEMLWSLSLCLPSVFYDVVENKSHIQYSLNTSENWTSLYNSNEDGVSINRFSHHVCSYKGPTLMIISCAPDQLFCVAADTEWRDGDQKFGGHACRAIQLKPAFRVLESGSEILLWNKSGRSHTQGIQVGRNPKAISLLISHDFETVTHYGAEYRLHSIEVWGCGTCAVKQAQRMQKEWEQREVQKAKQKKLVVNSNWRDSPDRLILQWGGINTDHDENSHERDSQSK